MMSEKPSSAHSLEQFILLAKSVKGAAAVELVKQVLETPTIFVFGELLDMPNIQELSKAPNTPYFTAVNLFAYGTYSDYIANKDKLPALTPAMLKKLKHLTIVSLATKSKCIPYPVLLEELGMKNLRELEDLIIEVIYSDIIRGKLDQKNQRLEVDYAIGRDIKPESVTEIIDVLQEWCTGCELMLVHLQDQVTLANQYKERQLQQQQETEAKVVEIKKSLKTTQPPDSDEHMVTDSREASSTGEKSTKKATKPKGIRGSGKFWKTS